MSIQNFSLTGTYTDLYQLTMAQAYFHKKKYHKEAVFDYFFRELPFDGGYAVFAGLQELLEILKDLKFTEEDIEYLRKQGFDKNFLNYLKEFHFTGTIYAAREGDIVFPNRPIVVVEAPLLQAQLIETLLLNILNYQTLIATKARRMRSVAGKRTLLDFGLRRSHCLGGMSATRACMIGGFDGTSNTAAGDLYDIPISGTMAHSFIQAHSSELTAFRHFAQIRPDDCVLLVDTYNTLKSGVPNAIEVARELKDNGYQLKGIRLDSGDLAYLAKKSRKMLDDAGFQDVKIAASNQLDEKVIQSLLNQGAPIDVFGVGTNLVTGKPDAALGGVYKLAYANGAPRMKFSENIKKTNLPHKKQVFRALKDDGSFYGVDAICMNDEETTSIVYDQFDSRRFLKLEDRNMKKSLHKVYEDGKIITDKVHLNEIARYSQSQYDKLGDEYKRFHNPHKYKVGISEKLMNERDCLMSELKENY